VTLGTRLQRPVLTGRCHFWGCKPGCGAQGVTLMHIMGNIPNKSVLQLSWARVNQQLIDFHGFYMLYKKYPI
ncbi:hypothetical protein ACW4FQ_29530, partial [Escherichia coli]